MIADELLNLAARVLLRVCQPLTAHSALLEIGRYLPQRRTPGEVRKAALALRLRGTCLSRALTVAARAPHADVVIGVRREHSSLLAHAWIELDDGPLFGSEPIGIEIARLRRRERAPLDAGSGMS